jgi:acetate kinase
MRAAREPRLPPARGAEIDTVLVLNAGSSSIKMSLFRVSPAGDLEPALRGLLEGIGTGHPHLTLRATDGEPLADEPLAPTEAADHEAAVRAFSRVLGGRPERGEIDAVGHRVVHGGLTYSRPVLIDDEVARALDALVPLAPLHQPHNIATIRAMAARLPGIPQVACFDTAFHRGHADVADAYALPWEFHERGVRRYGFHGLSYEYVASVLPGEIAGGRVVVAHLGSGASMCALDAGRSVDSTMGFTALDGLPMGTRTGQLDPGIPLFLADQGLSTRDIEALVYNKSGLLGLSGVSNDMRDLLASDEPRARFALDYFVYAISKHLGGLAAALGGLDGLVFTAGIGERSPEIRSRVSRAAAWLGVELDEKANLAHGPRISSAGSPVSVWVIPTNEELMIARHTVAVISAVGTEPAV